MSDSVDSRSGEQNPGLESNQSRSSHRPIKGDELVGKVLLDRFEIQSLLGEGAMAVVFKGLDHETQRTVALKKVASDDPEILKRFAREVELHQRLQHGNIVEAIDCITDEKGETYFVMEFLDGLSLLSYLQHEERVERVKDIHSIFDQICDALQHAHDAGVLHRDLKPGNIFLHQGSTGFQVKVLDFGIAKPLGELTALTQAGTAVGSPMYMSPEQCQGKRVDTRSDVYSLGILTYEIITGKLPFRGQNIMTILAAHCDPEKRPKPITELRPELPLVKHLNKIIMKALETNQDNRFSTIAEFRTAMALWNQAITLDTVEQVEVIKRLKSLYSVPISSKGTATVQDFDAVGGGNSGSYDEDGIEEDEELASLRKFRTEQKSQLRTKLKVQDTTEEPARRPNVLLIGIGVLLLIALVVAVGMWIMAN